MPQLKKHNLYKKHFNIKQENIILSFEGEFSQDKIVALGEKLKEKLSNLNEKNKLIKKTFAIFIELCQNIQHYSEDEKFNNCKNKTTCCGIIVVSEDKNSYFISAGNVVKNESIDFLIERCYYLNNLDDISLKKHYKQKLYNVRDIKGVIGGIGLIDIVRKSKNPLQYQPVSIDNRLSFWKITAKIDKEI